MTFWWKTFWSNDLSVKWPFGQMTFRSNDLSVKWPFGQMIFRSNDHFSKKAFGQMSFRSNIISVIWLVFRPNDLFRKYGLSVKRRSVKWSFGQMAFRSNSVGANGVRSNGVSVKWRLVKKKFNSQFSTFCEGTDLFFTNLIQFGHFFLF
jgi:hypothetical protein